MSMNPMNRKLFKSRDARNTLRNMGGIVASSPELSQTVAKYQEGGRVTGLEQMEMDPIRQGRATRIGGRDFVMLPNGVVLDARTQMPASPEVALAVQRRLNAFPERDPAISEEALAMRVNPSFATDMRDRGVGIGVSDRMPAAPSVGPAPTAPAAISPAPADISVLRTPPNMPQTDTPDDLRFQRMSVEEALSRRPGFRPGKEVNITGFGGQTIDELQAIIDDPASSPGAVETARTRLGAAQGVESLMQGTSDVLEAAPGAAYDLARPTLDMVSDAYALTGTAGNKLIDLVGRGVALADQGAGEAILDFTARNQEAYDRAASRFNAPEEADLRDDQKAARGFGRLADAPAPAPAAEEDGTVDRAPVIQEDETAAATPTTTAPAADAPDTEAATGTGTTAPTLDPEKVTKLMPSPDDTEDDIRSKYKQRLELFQEVLGEDEAGARNKAMDLAMIGLAIASGQSPDVLSNIAQGTLTGLQAMSTRDEAQRERARQIRTTALETVLEEEADTAAADAAMAKREYDRETDLMVARVRAADKDSTYADPYRVMAQAKAAARTRAKDPALRPPDMRPNETVEQYADRAGREALNLMAQQVGVTAPGAAGAANPADLEAAAKAAGEKTFVYNGMEYPVR